jgi:hypothetical protein
MSIAGIVVATVVAYTGVNPRARDETADEDETPPPPAAR